MSLRPPPGTGRGRVEFLWVAGALAGLVAVMCLRLPEARGEQPGPRGEGHEAPAAMAPSADRRSGPGGFQGWRELPNTRLRSACPPNTNDYAFLSHCSAVVGAWSGGALDTLRDRLLIWGGGHGDYYGNEVYVLDIPTSSVQRLTEPSPGFVKSAPCVDNLPDGSPVSRHTYGGLAYLPPVDKLLAYGGSRACGSGGFGVDTWTFDLKSNTWRNMQPQGARLGPSLMIAAFDPVTQKVFARTGNGFYAYDYTGNVWEQLRRESAPVQFTSAAIDPRRRRFVTVGGPSQGGTRAIDLSPGSDFRMHQLPTRGETAIEFARSPGLAYDPVRDRLAAWDGSKTQITPDSVYFLDLASLVWTRQTFPGGPRPGRTAGTWGRWQYVPRLDAFVILNSVDENAFLFRPGPLEAVPGSPGSSPAPTPVK